MGSLILGYWEAVIPQEHHLFAVCIIHLTAGKACCHTATPSNTIKVE